MDYEATVWARDVDGSGSLHICAKGDPGAVPLYDVAALKAAVEDERESCAILAYTMRGKACPFSSQSPPPIGPEDPCPICGGLGTDDAKYECLETSGAAIAAAISARKEQP